MVYVTFVVKMLEEEPLWFCMAARRQNVGRRETYVVGCRETYVVYLGILCQNTTFTLNTSYHSVQGRQESNIKVEPLIPLLLGLLEKQQYSKNGDIGRHIIYLVVLSSYII